MKVYGMVPAYNEANNIAEVIRRLKKVKIEPIVIDDASKDDTVKIARKSGAKVLLHGRNKGKAEAIKTGLKFLKGKRYDYVVLIDADMQYLPEDAGKLIDPLRRGIADFVAGYRDFGKVPFFRHRLGNFVWKTSFNMLFGTKFKDTNCGFVAMNKDAAEIIAKKIYGGYIIENSMFVHMLKTGKKIHQVPVRVRYPEKSEVKRGIRMVAGVSFYILHQGIRHRLKL